mmetsp:Transcript_4357/g.6724  ORF Transcript_4357/g.6724 Transcript_4357/m.6724 type:complete len:216 (+) Transcript_4357:150-797(+)
MRFRVPFLIVLAFSIFLLAECTSPSAKKPYSSPTTTRRFSIRYTPSKRSASVRKIPTTSFTKRRPSVTRRLPSPTKRHATPTKRHTTPTKRRATFTRVPRFNVFLSAAYNYTSRSYSLKYNVVPGLIHSRPSIDCFLYGNDSHMDIFRSLTKATGEIIIDFGCVHCDIAEDSITYYCNKFSFYCTYTDDEVPEQIYEADATCTCPEGHFNQPHEC